MAGVQAIAVPSEDKTVGSDNRLQDNMIDDPLRRASGFLCTMVHNQYPE
jgi:hypothetical protein